ncbi:M20/M25/M40 family metallo-hydrolase [Enemella sp. A6]|uniref:M20/M25/M40 family metallo-hydrolase n=1 Tax=Enemella sp. A6 TaxID=3440152 RepID=UPI003EBAC4E6
MTAYEQPLLQASSARLPQMLRDLERVITRETPSEDLEAVADGAAAIAALLHRRLGAEPEIVVLQGVTHLRLRFGEGDPKVVIVTHQDTVWPIGTLERLPFSIRDGILRGPGCFDMLSGLVMGIHALALIRELHGDEALNGVSLLVTGDEEVGSLTSATFIQAEATNAIAALVLEPSGDGGAIKVGRKGVSRYQLQVRGRAAHAGLEPEKGINAGVELAHQIHRLTQLADPVEGTTVTPTRLQGGTTVNTVPAEAWVDVDVRAWTLTEQRRVDEAMKSLTALAPQAQVVVSGGINRPPLEQERAQDLYRAYARVNENLGLPVPPPIRVGGGSDGNYTAAIGVPTLDGLGGVGDGSHADHEHVIIAELAPRTAALAGLILDRLGIDTAG